MKKARANDVQSWQRQQQAVSMPQLQQQPPPQPQLQQHQQPPFANHPAWYSNPHYSPPDMSRRQDQQHFPYGAPPPPQQVPQQHHPAAPVQPSMTHAQQPPPPQQQQQTPTPASAPAPRQRKRPAPQASHQPAHIAQHQQPPQPPPQQQQPQQVSAAVPPQPVVQTPVQPPPVPISQPAASAAVSAPPAVANSADSTSNQPPAKKSRTNTPWTPAEELRLKQMRDAGNSWAEIAKTFPSRTEGSVKKHWYKDMHYAEFAEDESQALLNAIKEYENNKWKVIGQKVGKPAKACEQYAKEHFPDQLAAPKNR